MISTISSRETTFTQRAGVGVDWLLKTGARISSDLTIDFFKFVNGDLRSVNNSRFAATLSQPLLRGAGYLAVTENLTQAERDVLYSIRDFARFRKEFAIGVATRYYQILQARDTVRNNWSGYQGFLLSVKREQALAEEGRSTQTDLGQLQQAALNSELSWINSLQNYLEQLDNFKIELGLPVDARIVLDDRELEKTQDRQAGAHPGRSRKGCREHPARSHQFAGAQRRHRPAHQGPRTRPPAGPRFRQLRRRRK